MGVQLPTYVAGTYNSMPPSSAFEIVARTVQTLIQEISDLKHEISDLKKNRQSNEVRSQDNSLILEDIMVIKGELRKLNHKLISDDVRRSSIALNSLDESCINLRHRMSEDVNLDRPCLQEEVCPLTSIASLCDLPISLDDKHLNKKNMDGLGSTASPCAPPASQEDWYQRERLMDDDGGSLTAPTFADTVKSTGMKMNGDRVAPTASPCAPPASQEDWY